MKNEDSLLRPELLYEDLVFEGKGDGCGARLQVGPGHFHDCTRPPEHKGQHYSFNGMYGYEILWPIAEAPQEWTKGHRAEVPSRVAVAEGIPAQHSVAKRFPRS